MAQTCGFYRKDRIHLVTFFIEYKVHLVVIICSVDNIQSVNMGNDFNIYGVKFVRRKLR